MAEIVAAEGHSSDDSNEDDGKTGRNGRTLGLGGRGRPSSSSLWTYVEAGRVSPESAPLCVPNRRTPNQMRAEDGGKRIGRPRVYGRGQLIRASRTSPAGEGTLGAIKS